MDVEIARPKNLVYVDGVPSKECRTCKIVKPLRSFYKSRNCEYGRYYYKLDCKRCWTNIYAHKRSRNPRGFKVYGYVPVADLQMWLDEIVKRCGGSERAAARTLEVDRATFGRWRRKLRTPEGRIQRYIQREFAQHIIRTLHALRTGDIQPDVRKSRKTVAA